MSDENDQKPDPELRDALRRSISYPNKNEQARTEAALPLSAREVADLRKQAKRLMESSRAHQYVDVDLFMRALATIDALTARAEQAERDIDAAKTDLLHAIAYGDSQRKLSIVQLAALVLKFQQLQHAAMHDATARIAELTRENERLRGEARASLATLRRHRTVCTHDGTCGIDTEVERLANSILTDAAQPATDEPAQTEGGGNART